MNLHQTFREEGYCVAKNLLAKKDIERVLADIHALFLIQLKRHNIPSLGDLFADMQALFTANHDSYLACARTGYRLASLQSLLMSAPIMKLLADFGFHYPTVPVGPVLLIMSDKLRIKGGYHGLDAHQDWTSTQGSLDTVTVWFPFMDVTKNLFPLEIAPKSHLRGIWPGARAERNVYEVDKNSFSDSDFTQVEAKCGDVVIMSGFALHRTGIGNSSGLRIATSIRFDNTSEPDFVERNFPCAYARTPKADFSHPLPEPEKVRAVFGK